MTNKERLEANNAKIEEITKVLKGKMLGSGDGEYFVKVIDYDGTVLKEVWLNDGDTFELPSPPSHERLAFQQWISTETFTDNTIIINGNDALVGAVYDTKSGLSEFDIEINKAIAPDIENTPYTITFNMDGTKDWGDGTSDDLTNHTYTSYGNYTITCNGTKITSSGSYWGMFEQSNQTSTPCYFLKHVRLSSNVTSVTQRAFYYCYDLETISIPYRLSVLTFDYDYRLKCVVFSHLTNGLSLTDCYNIEHVVFNNNATGRVTAGSGLYNLKEIVFQRALSSINPPLRYLHQVKKITIPSNISTWVSGKFNDMYGLEAVEFTTNQLTTIPTSAFDTARALKKLKLPSSITKIQGYAFRDCKNLSRLDFSDARQVPTLEEATAFSGVNKFLKVVVPDNLYDEWVVATNWSNIAKYIYKASEAQE